MNDERPDLYKPLSHIAWGYLLLHVNFNLGTLNVLPNWLGFLMIRDELKTIGQIVPSALLLRPLVRVLALWEGLLWVLALLGKEFSFYPLELVIMIIALYFHFQLLTDLAQIARQFPPELDEATELKPLDQRILRSRTVRILLATLMALPLPAKLLGWMPFTVVIVLANFVVAVRIMAQLFDLRRAFPKPEEEPKYGES